ncbi:efflux RND transporter periplasmic adaptor subunit [Anaeromicrobium sediminis]|uniref:Uncharacterized protein n=1 Tax=Anaeromicrobium sediminis TaxID=1478221 RepID=A0A267MME4_9FIRM|nr:efflux RND transporter periplasmic adaptor subunit [Anaeromicrobium sediminis]PAB60759.1 hypothetical protein CCE28_04265 [Anaeromicrobium sediminis]
MKKRYLILIMVFILSLSMVGCSKEKTANATSEAPINVETSLAALNSFTLQTALSGKISAIDEADISSKVSGTVQNVNVEIGDFVKEGNILISLEKTDFKTSLEEAQASYSMALASYNNTLEKIKVAKANYRRMEELYSQGALSKRELEQAELEASDTNLELAKAKLLQSQATLTKVQNSYSDSNITAPISGFITAVNVSKGESISPSVPVVSISNIDPVKVETSVSGYLVNKLHKGDLVDVFIKSVDTKPFKGTINAISPAPSKDNLTYPIQITIENKDSLVKPGMFAEIVVSSDKKENILTIPSQAVVIKDGEPVVFVIKDSTAYMKNIEVGLDNGTLVEVLNGLSENEEVVIKGQNYLEDGNQVKVIK